MAVAAALALGAAIVLSPGLLWRKVVFVGVYCDAGHDAAAARCHFHGVY